MSDIVERLHMIRGTQFTPIEDALVAEAADEIEALRAEVEQLREALDAVTKVRVNGWDNIWAGANRCGEIARAALTQTKGKRHDA